MACLSLFSPLCLLYTFMGRGDFNAAVTKALAPNKVGALLRKRSEEIVDARLRQKSEDILSEANAKVQIAVASICETAKEAEQEARKIKARAVKLAQPPLSETLPDDIRKT